jgi:hypothetical protein
MHRTIRSLVVSLTLLVPAACSDEAELTPEDFIGQYATAYCGYLFSCCDTSERSYGSQSACQNAVKEQADLFLAFRGEEGAHATFQIEAAQQCLDRLDGADCKDATLFNGCLADAAAAQQAEGDECTYPAECTSRYCNQPQKHTLGSCGSVGGGCNGLDLSCTSGTYCGSDGQCLGKKADGEACVRAGECTSGICSPTYKQCVAAKDPRCDGQ